MIIGKPYKIMQSYTFIELCIQEMIATEDDYYISHDMDEFRIQVGRSDEKGGTYMVTAFEGTAYEKIYKGLDLYNRLDTVRDILDKIAEI